MLRPIGAAIILWVVTVVVVLYTLLTFVDNGSVVERECIWGVWAPDRIVYINPVPGSPVGMSQPPGTPVFICGQELMWESAPSGVVVNEPPTELF